MTHLIGEEKYSWGLMDFIQTRLTISSQLQAISGRSSPAEQDTSLLDYMQPIV